jgi:glycosyltransferase involved in cell wall biosynthesis
MTEAVLVSVIVPAFNACETLDATLRSARGQTHRNLEVIVVDDGSTDRTADVALRHAAVDPRVRVRRQANAGVAEARNQGWRASRGAYVAFLDADDLWAPTKIEKQVKALSGAGGDVGLAYTWSIDIDAAGRLLDSGHYPDDEGDVLIKMFSVNLVGNGSAALVRRAVLDELGGFDPRLRQCGAQGCEDLLFYLTVAGRYGFRVIREPLTGYRRRPGSLSADARQMARSYRLVAEEMIQRYPDRRREIELGVTGFIGWRFEDALKAARWADVAYFGSATFARSPWRGLRIAAACTRFTWRRLSDRRACNGATCPFPSGALFPTADTPAL